MTAEYLQKCRGLIDTVAAQESAIGRTADLFAATILAGRMVHLFGSGHSRILVEEMWPRYGSFPGFNPIVELSLSFHNLVVGANGQISIGKEFAGRQVVVEEREPGVWLVRTATVVPDNERWLHEPRGAADLQESLAWAQGHPAADRGNESRLKKLRDGTR